MSTTLGTLGINIAAYAGQFLAELTKAEGAVNKFERSLRKTITRASLDTMGMGNAARALSSELQYVFQNVEKIPGIDPMTIASVMEMRTEVEAAKNTIHGWVAESIAFFAQLGKSAGMFGAVLAEVVQKTTLKDLFTNPTAIAGHFAAALQDVDAALQAEFTSAAKAAQVQNELAAATASATKAKKEAADVLALISKQNEEWSRTEAANLARMKAQGETIRRDVRTPLEEWADTLTELNDLLAVGAINQETFNRAMKNADLRKDGEQPVPKKGELTPAEDEAREVTSQIGRAWDELGESMSDSMGRSLLGMNREFESFGDSVKRIFSEMALEMLKMEIQAKILTPIFNKIKGKGNDSTAAGGGGSGIFDVLKGAGKSVLGLLGFADGGRPPVGMPSIVGERGPELFVPDAAGTIVPNHALGRGSNAGPGEVKNFYIDARGADRTGLAQLQSYIRQLAGPGVVEQRALGAVMDYRRRGASA